MMQKVRLMTVVLTLIAALCISGNAFAGGAEDPLIPFCSCLCLKTADQEDIDALPIGRPFLSGTFTISDTGDDTLLVHLVLRKWGRIVFLAPVETFKGSLDICDEAFDENHLLYGIKNDAVICNLKGALIELGIIEAGLTPLVKYINITDKGGCGTPEAPNTDPDDDLARGIIKIGFVPSEQITELCDPPAVPCLD